MNSTGVAGSGVLGQRRVRQVQVAVLVADDVFQHRAEAVGGGPDLGFGLLGQVDHLGIAAALEVEDPGGAPAMLIVANQLAVGVGRQRGLARAGQAEEQGDVAVLADIGAAMHGHHALAGSSQFMMVKMDFFTSPAYSLPAMRMIFCSNDRAMVVLDRTPSTAGSV